MNRTTKIENIELALQLLQKDIDFSTVAQYTSMQGPSLTIKHPQYEGLVQVEFGTSSIVRFTIAGYVQRFAEPGSFIDFFKTTLQPSPADLKEISARLPGSVAVGADTIYCNGEQGAYMLQKTQHGLQLKMRNEKFLLSVEDAISMLGGA